MSSHPFPVELILIRHGESEGDLAQRMAAAGDHSAWTEEFKQRHSCKYRLTQRGVEQAKIAGEWIRKNIATYFDVYYCSEFLRAMETAAHLNIDGATWFSEFFLREQDQGILAGRPRKEVQELYAHEFERRSRDVFYYQPPGGESIANLSIRVEKWLNELQAHWSGSSVIAVVHGTTLKAARLRIERLKQEEWYKLDEDPQYIAHNCQIIHYSRRNPIDGYIHRELCWVRSICPWDLTKTASEWRRISPPTYDSKQLLRYVEMAPRIIDNSADDDPVLSND